MANDAVYDPDDGAPDHHGRRRFLTATTAAVGAVGAGFAAVPFIKSWNPSARAQLAGAPVTVDISALQDGQRLMVEWRGQPIWIVRRSEAILQALPTLDGELRDPNSENADQQPAYIQRKPSALGQAEISVRGPVQHMGCSRKWSRDPRAVDRTGRAVSAPAQVEGRHGRPRYQGVPATNLVVTRTIRGRRTIRRRRPGAADMENVIERTDNKCGKVHPRRGLMLLQQAHDGSHAPKTSTGVIFGCCRGVCQPDPDGIRRCTTAERGGA